MKRFFSLALALVFMTGTAFAQNNDATITQTGDDHEAQIDQAGLEQVATITQFGGNDNSAFVEQGPDATQTSTVTQEGSNNLARTTLTRDPAESEQIQVGSGNSAQINQAADPDSRPFNANGYKFTQKQYGDDNVAAASGSGSSRTDQYQDGDRNSAVITGLGNNVSVTQKQVGNDNEAGFNGYRYDFNKFDQQQYGSDNVSVVNGLSHKPGTSRDDAMGFTYQEGDDNYASVTGNQMAGIVEISQIGNSNDAEVAFTVQDNTAIVSQTGNGNSAVINQ